MTASPTRMWAAARALLLIHGMAGSSETWRAVIPQLLEEYRVVAPDLLGHGQSDKPRGDYSLGAFAVWLRDLLDELGVTRATIVGHSLGGGVAMQFVYQHPDYCQRLDSHQQRRSGSRCRLDAATAVGSWRRTDAAGDRPSAGADRRQQAADAGFPAAGIQSPRGAEVWSAYSSLADSQTRNAFLRTLRSVVDYRGQAVSALNRLHLTSDLPTMAIWGDQDQIIPVDHAHAAHAARPGSRIEVLAGVGHFPQVERPS